MALPATVKNKKQGDIIRSEDWNIVTNEVDQLDKTKANLSGAVFAGPLSVQFFAPDQPQLALSGGNGDVNKTQGDLSIGNSRFQLRIGVDTNAGDVRMCAIQPVGTEKLNNRFLIGVRGKDVANIHSLGASIDGELMVSGEIQFGPITDLVPKIRLWGDFGIGMQDHTMYFRSMDRHQDGFAWFAGGVHRKVRHDSGGGALLMTLSKATKSGTAGEGTELTIPNLVFSIGGGPKRQLRYDDLTGNVGIDTSSQRYKTDIAPLEEDFKQILKVQPRTYKRHTSPDYPEIGFIAEEFDALGLKRLVFYDKEGRPDGLDYEKVCIYLLQVVKAHEAQLNPGSPYLRSDTEQENIAGAPVAASQKKKS